MPIQRYTVISNISDRQYNENINTEALAVTSESAIHKHESWTRHRPILHGALMSPANRKPGQHESVLTVM